ncbi:MULTISPECIES: metal-dependent transcriptional regulator [Chryseobacterium]|uniref:Transcriptional regulator MntR n=1 Tax=Chryseobacterium salivictor TaxID=2547600 RepID=A0A4P6ZEA2_9FLAO|nr:MULTISPECIES: metal-dependent transcriptional regulator [Chryseobacterium]MDQ0476061.1 DtxR family Mn-dependent transcriptional regulator [Chryseobacterium sp. MDT2-18]QBO57916.1 Iron-dependent repressor IdeR [Chryseobacterium salivictor]
MISLTEENYLKAIFHLRNDDNTVTVNELSKFLNVKMPSVNNMMKKFAQKNWIIYETYKPLRITEEGNKQAALIVRKHRLTEMFLVEKMNFGWENVHEIAEQLEHVHSDIFFDKMDEILQYPKFDPHGEPIPDKEGNIIALDLQKLSSCKIGDPVIFSSVTVSDDEFLSYLNSKELELGKKLQIMEIEKYDQSMSILKEDGNKITLSKMVCDKILVKR